MTACLFVCLSTSIVNEGSDDRQVRGSASARVDQLELSVCACVCTYVTEEQNRTSNFRLNDRLRARACARLSFIVNERTKISPSLGRSPDIIQ